MADLATLNIAVDSRPVTKASTDLDGLTASAGRTGSSVDKLTAANARMAAAFATSNKPLIEATRYLTSMQIELEKVGKSSLQIKAMEAKMMAAAAPTAELSAEIRRTAAELIIAERNASKFNDTTGTLTASAGAQRAGMQQLSYQIGDAATMFSLGANASQIFASQLGQTIGAVQLMTGGASKLAAFLAGPWGMALTAGAIVLAPFVGKLWDIVMGANAATSALQAFINKQREAVAGAVEETQAMVGLSKARSELLEIELRLAKRPKGPDGKAMFSFADYKRQAELQWQIVEAQGALDAAEAKRAAARKSAASVSIQSAKAEASYGSAIRKTTTDTDAAAESIKRYADALGEVRSQMAGVNPLMPSDNINDLLEAQAKAQNEIRAKDAAALQSNIDFATNAAADIGNLIGGSFGRGVKDLATILNRDFPKLTGKLGETLKNIAEDLNDFLGDLGTSMKELGAYAGFGGAAASATGGNQLGGSVGGALGGVLGKGVKFLGDFGGPLGAIAGGILGGIVGGLFKKTKQASATISSIGGQAVVSTITGNNAELKGAANNMAKGLLKGIADIAEQLGGTLGGAVKLSIGQRNKDFVVDPTGMGRTKGSGVINFKQDQGAAVAYVTQLAIQQGIITGISAGAQALIKAGGEISDQVQKALKFDQVFKDLKAESDPLGASLDGLASEMAKLKAIFDEAGASAADYAKLEELFAIKQAKAIFEAERPRRELEIALMEAQGKATEALAAKRALELEGMDANLRAIKRQIFAAEDVSVAAEAAAAAQAAAAEAAAAAQAAAAEAAAAAQVEAAQKIADAEGVLRDAYERESGQLIETAQRFRELGKALRDVSRDIGAMMGVGGTSAGNLRGRFFSLAASARLGDTNALEGLPALAREYADLVTETAPDRLSMIRELSAIQEQTLAAGVVADRQASVAEMQLATMQQQVGALITLNETMVTVATATRQLVALNGGTPAPVASSAINQPSAVFDSNQVMTTGSNDNVRNEVSAMRDEMKVALFQIAKNTGKASDQLQRWDGEGLPEARGY